MLQQLNSEGWNLALIGALLILVVWQLIRSYQVRRRAAKQEELFKIITENADDMIALVDMKRKRHYNSPAYKRVLGYSPAELAETTSFDQIHTDDRLMSFDGQKP